MNDRDIAVRLNSESSSPKKSGLKRQLTNALTLEKLAKSLISKAQIPRMRALAQCKNVMEFRKDFNYRIDKAYHK